MRRNVMTAVEAHRRVIFLPNRTYVAPVPLRGTKVRFFGRGPDAQGTTSCYIGTSW